MIIFQPGNAGGKTEGTIEQYLVFRLIRTVFTSALTAEGLDGGQVFLLRNFRHIICNAIVIAKFRFHHAFRCFIAENKFQMGIDDCLPLESIQIIIFRNGNISKYLQIRLPADDSTSIFLVILFLTETGFGPGLIFALFKMQAVFHPITANGDIHIFRRILCGTGTQTIQTQRKLIVLAIHGFIFAAGIQLTEYQFPVIPLFIGIVIHWNTASMILHLNGMVRKTGNHNFIAKAFPGFINGIGQDFKYCMLTAIQSIRAKNNARTFADTVSTLECRDALIAVLIRFFHL